MAASPTSGRTTGRRARRGFSLVEILVTVAAVGILMAISFKSFANAKDRSSNAQMESNVHEVQSALLLYESDNERYPHLLAWKTPPDATKTYLLTPGRNIHYLPGDKLPKVPWTDNYQGNNLNENPANLPTTDATKGFYRIDDLNTNGNNAAVPNIPAAMGAGKVPAKATSGPQAVDFAITNYGALVYDVNAGRSLFIVHGIGKLQANAVVVGLATNAR